MLDRARPVLWVTGPPGSGKTTLVATYLQARRLGTLWYQVDEGDADPAAFFYRLGLAAERAGARPGRPPLPLLTPEYQGGVPAFSRRYFRALIGRLRVPFALVLDDYHLVEGSRRLHEALREGLQEIPAGGRAVVISRAQPPPALVRLQACGSLRVLGWEALRFTLPEWHDAARLRSRGIHRRGALRGLHARMDGWIAGLVLATEHAADDPAAGPALSGARAIETVFDYFAEEVLRTVARPTRDFLIQTALLPSMTSSLAQQLTGARDAARYLAHLCRRNYFVARETGTRDAYRYHPLFRQFLLAQARERLSPARLRRLNRRAAKLLAGDAEVEHAVTLFRDSGDSAGLAALLEERAASLVSQGRTGQLEAWIDGLPDDLLARRPWLAFWLGTCRLPRRPDRSQGHFETAYLAFEQARDGVAQLLAGSGVVDSILYQWGDCTRLDDWIPRLDGLADRYPALPSDEARARVASSMLAALLFRQPHHPAIDAWAKRARQGAMATRHPSQRMLAGYYPVLHRFWMGDPAGAATLLDSLRDAGCAEDAPPLARVMWYALEAIHLWHGAHGRECLDGVARGLDVARQSGVHIWDFQLLGQGVFGAFITDDRPARRRFLQGMAAALDPGRRLDVSLYHYHAGWEALLAGDTARAIRHGEQGLGQAVAMGTPFPEALNRLSMAHILRDAGRPDQAALHLERGRAIADRMQSAQLRFMADVVDADLALERGDDAAALPPLRRAMALARQQGFVNTPGWHPRVMARLCVRALEAGIEVDFVRDLVRRRGLVPAVPPLGVDLWPWPVRLRTLGSFAIEVEGRPLGFSRKAQQRPLALLKALVALGGRGVPEERLVDALWGEAEGDAGHQAFKIALHRLRRLLRQDGALLRQGGRVSLDPGVCWVDAWAVERALDEAAAAARRGDPGRADAATERALALYRGPFLDEDTRLGWTTSLRERLRKKLIRGVALAAGQCERRGAWARAAELYERGLAVEELAQDLYRGLIECQTRRGRRRDALAASPA